MDPKLTLAEWLRRDALRRQESATDNTGSDDEAPPPPPPPITLQDLADPVGLGKRIGNEIVKPLGRAARRAFRSGLRVRTGGALGGPDTPRTDPQQDE